MFCDFFVSFVLMFVVCVCLFVCYLCLKLNLLLCKINVNKIEILEYRNNTVTFTKSGLKSLLAEVEGGGWRRRRRITRG